MMDPTTITAVTMATIGAIGGIGIPVWNNWRQKTRRYLDTQVVSWEGMNKALRAERDHLQQRLDTAEARHREQIKQLEEEWESRTATMRHRITELEAEAASLRVAIRSLGGAP